MDPRVGSVARQFSPEPWSGGTVLFNRTAVALHRCCWAEPPPSKVVRRNGDSGQLIASTAAATLVWMADGSGAYPMASRLVWVAGSTRCFRYAFSRVVFAASRPLEQTIS